MKEIPKWKKYSTFSRWTLQYIYSHLSFVLLFGFAYECEVQENPFDLCCLVLKYNTSNPK
jgi:hypothetical protein